MPSGPRWWRDFRAQLAIVVVGSFVLRAIAVVTWSRQLEPQGDQNFYWRSGQDLSQFLGFVYRNNFGERVPTAIHPPLYSAYLGVVSFVGGNSPAAMRMASALFGALTILVVGLAARRMAGHRVGILAALLAAIYPNLWVNDVQLQSEAVYAFTVALILLASYRFRDARTNANAAFLGLSIALASLARAEALVLFVLLAVPLVLLRGKRARVETDAPAPGSLPAAESADPAVAGFWDRAETGVGSRLRMLGVVAIVGFLVLLPWVARNLVTFQKPAVMSSGAGFVLEISNCDQTFGLAPPNGEDGKPLEGQTADYALGYWTADCDRSDIKRHPDDAIPWPAGDETVVEAHKRQIGLDYMKAHKAELPKVLLARVGRIWDLWRPGQSYDFNKFWERRGDLTTLGGMAQYYVMLPLSIVGLVSMWRRRITVIPFVAIAISVTMTAAVSFGITRYRVGADVAICLLAAVGIDAIIRALRPTHEPTTPTRPDSPSGTPTDSTETDSGTEREQEAVS